MHRQALPAQSLPRDRAVTGLKPRTSSEFICPVPGFEAQAMRSSSGNRMAANQRFISDDMTLTTPQLTHLQRLEAESIHILREVVAECERPVMLYSIGKDSSV